MLALRTPEPPSQGKELEQLAKVQEERKKRLNDDRPREIFRIRKKDCPKFPPLPEKKVCPRYVDERLDESFIDLDRFVNNLLPEIMQKSELCRTTQKSPNVTDTNELRLWAEFVHEKSRAGSSLQRGNVLSIARTLSSLPNFNQDLLEKEVAIKRILEHHRPTLLRSLRNMQPRVRFRREVKLTVRGNEDTIRSDAAAEDDSGRCSSLSDSAFGEWGGRESTDDYLPSQRTLVTSDDILGPHTTTSALDKEEVPEELPEDDLEEELDIEEEVEEVEEELGTPSPTPSPIVYGPPTPSPTPTPPPPPRVMIPRPRTKTPTPPPPATPPSEEPPVVLEEVEVPPPPSIPEVTPAPDITPAPTESKPGTAPTTQTGASSSMEEVISLKSSRTATVTPITPYTYKPKTPVKKVATPPRTPTPPPPPPPPVVKPPTPTPIPEPPKRGLPPPPKKKGLSFAEEEALRKKKEAMERESRRRGRRAAKLKKPDPIPYTPEEMVPSQEVNELTGSEEVSEILEKFLIIDKTRINFLYKTFNDYDMRREGCLTHKELKKALAQLKTGTKITRNQLKFIELVLGVDKSTITFHTFAVLATMIDHMAHKDPKTADMFEGMDMTRLEHDLPRLKRLFHCVSEKDDFGWPRLTTKALDIELRAGGLNEDARNKFIDALDPDKKGNMTIFDFIIYMPLWMTLHDGIVDNPLNEIDRDIVTPVHRNWGVSVLWLPEENAVDPRASPASGCGSDRSTPGIYIESPSMRRVLGADEFDDEDEDEEGIANSDDG